MTQKKGYDVLRFIEHGNTAYVSTSCVEGVTLIQWLGERPEMKKADCLGMIQEVTRQLELLHKSKGSPVYQYVNPYCIVYSDDEKLYLIDMHTEGSAERLRKMQSRKIREKFLPEEDPYYQNSTIQTDLYGLGKTIQFILSAVSLASPLTKREEKQLKKVISRCLSDQPKKAWQSAEEVRKYLPIGKTDEQEKTAARIRKAFLLLGIVVTVVGTGFFVKTSLLKSSHELGESGIPETDISSLREFEPGDGDDGISLEADSGENKTETEKKEETEPQVMESTSEKLEETENQKENTEKEKDELEESGEEDREKWLLESLAKAQSYETIGRLQEAADLYQDILITLTSIPEKEKLYEKSARLYMETGDYDKAYEILEFGLSELSVSEYLWNAYLDLLTENNNLDEEKKTERVEKFVKEHEEYGEDECYELTKKVGFAKAEMEKVPENVP